VQFKPCVSGKTPEEQASDRVAQTVRAEVTAMVLAQACARAARHVRMGLLSVDDAVRMASAWALGHVDPTPPTPQARAA
jgi:hypothetical protein